MPDGGCFCGQTRIRYTGDIQAKALCHCIDCRKISGSTYSTNIIVPGEGFSVISGQPKTISKKGDDTGNEVTSHFCPNCGTTLFREGATFGDAKVIKVGVMDDVNALESVKPGIELYTPHRPSWVASVAGADQKKNMPDSESLGTGGGMIDQLKAKMGTA